MSFFERSITDANSKWNERAERISFFNPSLFSSSSNDTNILSTLQTLREYYLEAGLTFVIGCFVASVLASSASVEAALNHDPRLKDLKEAKRIGLDRSCLTSAKAKGLPIDKLLTAGDSLEQGDIRFIDIRNKFAHGDIQLPANTLSAGPMFRVKKRKPLKDRLTFAQYPSTLSLVQLRLAHNFLAELSKQPEFDKQGNQ
jgi:hypothetical protein